MKKPLLVLVQVLFSAAILAEASVPRAVPESAGRAAEPGAGSRRALQGHPVGDAPGAIAAGAPASAPAPVELSDVGARLRAARSAVRAPNELVPQPQPSATVVAPAPLAARVGRDVTLVRRPGVGTPMQIRGEGLQLRRQAAEPGEDDELETAKEFLRANRSLLLLADPDTELSTRQRTKDELGYRHLKFEQRFRGLSVWPNELIVHLDRETNVYLMNGTFVPTPRLATLKPVVGATAAARIALTEAGGGRPARTKDPELFIYAPGNRPPRLAWRAVVSPSFMESWLVVVDAINGTRLAKISQVKTENVAGSGVDSNGLTRQLNVWKEGATYYLVDASKSMYDATSDPPNYATTRGAIFVYDAENTPANSDPSLGDATWHYVTSSTPSSWTSPDAISAAFGLGWTFDYYKDTHGRNSLDGKGGSIYSLVRIGVDFDNAFWSDQENAMCFGDGKNYAGSLDIVGHELTHGVTSNAADLVYQDQSGALNEAFSDIFGEMVELYTYGSHDWLIGSQLASPSRSMADPSAFDDPGKMSEFVNTDSDSGGVHTNSGIFNHTFYYLAEGLNGAIGESAAERIFYRALTTHLTQNSQFLDARLACIQSAKEIFGANSTQAQRTADAFDATEILEADQAPGPNDSPVNAANSTFFIYRDGNFVLGRRESALGDPSQGVRVSSVPVAEARPSVTGDGTLAFFVNAQNDGCFLATNPHGAAPSCLGLPGSIASVAMSRDGNVYGFVLLDGAGNRDSRITVVDLVADTALTYTLASAPTDGGAPSEPLFADAMDFTENKRFLLYDALYSISLGDGTDIGLWSISALDFSSNQSYSVVSPTYGFDIFFPSTAHANGEFYTFEVDHQSDGKADVYVGNLFTGGLTRVINGISSGYAVPAFTGDDRGVVYSYPDSNPTGISLAFEGLAADHQTPVGNPTQWIYEAAYGVIYRRGADPGPTPGCEQSATALCLSGGRFQVGVTFTTAAGQSGSAQAVRLTADTGYFTFFNPANVEVVVKVLNACGLGQRFWVFGGGLTNVATVMTVTDTLTGVTRTYTNPRGVPFQPVQDTSAFATCFANSVSDPATEEEIRAIAGAAAYEVERLAGGGADPAFDAMQDLEVESAAGTLDTEAVAACAENGQTLCLNNGRFRVQSTWRKSDGRTGAGNAVRLTGDTGYFWFFSSANVEMVVKVLNACGFNNNYWTFAGGLTNVQVTTTVTDTLRGNVKTYTNPLGRPFQPIQDTSSFPTCP